MIYLQDGEDHPMTVFIFVSLIIHALLFLTYPKWSSLLVSDKQGFGEHGVIQIVAIESSTASQSSPITDPNSQTSAPKASEPRSSEQPTNTRATTTVVPEDKVPSVPKPKPQPKPETPSPVERQPDVKAQVPAEPKPQPQAEQPPITTEVEKPLPELPAEVPVEPLPEPQPVETAREVLTSEAGTEVVIPETSLEPAPPLQAEPRPEPTQRLPEVTEVKQSASGEVDGGGDDDAETGAREAGTDPVEISPPPPPPPPSGSSLYAGGSSPVYPKNAQHEGVEGEVHLEVTVSSAGETLAVIVTKSSGDIRLDEQAKRTIEQLWRFKGAVQDYVLELKVVFARNVTGGFVQYDAEVRFGNVRWLNEN